MTIIKSIVFSIALTAALPLFGGENGRFTNSLGMVFVPVADTAVSFSIWDTRVQDYQAFVTSTKRPWEKPGFAQTGLHPAVKVSWNDAQAFCAWLTAMEKKTGHAYRLPTDTEWSAAALLKESAFGTPAEKNHMVRGVYSWGSSWPPPAAAGNFADETLRTKKKNSFLIIDGYNDGYADTSPVGTFHPNANGLYDMGGNVWQWCEDWYDTNHHDRVLRGGSCVCVPRMLWSSWRNAFAPSNTYSYLGFRCVAIRAGEKKP